MSKKLGVIIDFDNTLVATNGFIGRHLTKTCQKLGLGIPNTEVLEKKLRQNPPFEEIFTDLFKERGEDVLAAYRENAMETLYEETPGGNLFVQTLVSQEALIVIVSNRVNKLEERLIQAEYDPKSFLAILKAEPAKPDQQAYERAMALLSGREIIIIGDHTDDYLACSDNLKKNFVAVTSGLTTAEEFEKMGVAKNRIWPKLEPQKLLII